MRWFRIFIVLCCLTLPATARPQFLKLAGRNVEIWRPAKAGRHPLVLFSHGFKGLSGQSAQLTKALAAAGYLVLAPDHQDRFSNPDKAALGPQQDFDAPAQWTDDTYRDRADDLKEVLAAALDEPGLQAEIDPQRLVLMGHSLGGYTILGLAGARPAWCDPRFKPCALVCLSPYVRPYLASGSLKNLRVPVMYQGGTRDFFITPSVVRPGGAFDQTPAPKIFVNFRGAGHQSWTGLERTHHPSIQRYTVAFLDRYVRGRKADPCLDKPLPDVQRLNWIRQTGAQMTPQSAALSR